MKYFLSIIILFSTMAFANAQNNPFVSINTNSMSIEQLKNAYWICDYVSMHELLGFEDAVNCGAVYEALKQRKFNGSFHQIHQWWKENRHVQHARVRQQLGR